MTEAGPSTQARFRPGGKGGPRRNNNNLKYGTPLPILLPCSPLYPHPPRQPSSDVTATSRLLEWMSSALTLHTPSPLNPMCSGFFDARTKSVWVTSQLDRNILFERGFFGKGNLSRSDPSWWKRRVKVLQGGNSESRIMLRVSPTRPLNHGPSTAITAEEVTAMRRRERKQFKIDRAQAMLNASLAAEAILRGTSTPGTPATPSEPLPGSEEAEAMTEQSVDTGSDRKLLDSELYELPEGVTRLTPQTFLQRPTRPGVRPAGLLRPTPPPAATSTGEAAAKVLEGDGLAEGLAKAEELGEKDQEHLQLNLEEAFFLCWAIGCLRVLHKEEVSCICLFP